MLQEQRGATPRIAHHEDDLRQHLESHGFGGGRMIRPRNDGQSVLFGGRLKAVQRLSERVQAVLRDDIVRSVGETRAT